MNELDRLEQISKDVEKTTSNLKAIRSDLKPFRNIVKVLFVALLFSLLTLAISVFFSITMFEKAARTDMEIIADYEVKLKEQGKTIITDKQLNYYIDYYEYFLDLDEIKDEKYRETLISVRRNIEKWHKAREQNR